ncbi:MAG: hypothetical protein GTO24_09890 [candidate division Zixibacteria bacterium]|nr:hypothetical protein [candidate division Zixibacteria bacterium]
MEEFFEVILGRQGGYEGSKMAVPFRLMEMEVEVPSLDTSYAGIIILVGKISPQRVWILGRKRE